MKAILEFKLPEEKQDFEYASRGAEYMHTIDEIWNEVFRPHYKHGYKDKELQKLMEDNWDVASKIMDKLADIYRDVTKEI